MSRDSFSQGFKKGYELARQGYSVDHDFACEETQVVRVRWVCSRCDLVFTQYGQDANDARQRVIADVKRVPCIEPQHNGARAVFTGASRDAYPNAAATIAADAPAEDR